MAATGCPSSSFGDIGRRDIGTVYTSPDMPIGTVLYSYSFPDVMLTPYCNPVASATMTMLTANQLSSYGNSVYDTPIKGVGIRVSVWGIYAESPSITVNIPMGTSVYGPTAYTRNTTVELVKTGPISAGTTSLERIMGIEVEAKGGINYLVINNITIVASTCTTSTTNIQITLDDILASKMNSVGSTYNPKNFNVGLNCDPGARVSATLRGNDNPDTSADGVLQLSNAGSDDVADGVGIQILSNSIPMPLDKLMPLKTFTGTQETLPFTVQYYQTKSEIKTGKANATATLEITYQ